MEILNFGPSGSSPKKRRNRVALVVGALALAAIGSTFAANISLNNSSSIEYGQGLSQAVACDATSINIAPQNTFVNATGYGAFNVSSITIYDTNTTATTGFGTAACASKYFQLSAYGPSSNSALLQCKVQLPSAINSTPASWTPTLSGSACSTGGAATVAGVNQNSIAYGTDGYTITITSPTIAASGISKFTLESSNS